MRDLLYIEGEETVAPTSVSIDHPPNDRVNRSSIARVPFACSCRVPVPVTCAWPIIGPLADVRFSQSSPDQVNQLFFS